MLFSRLANTLPTSCRGLIPSLLVAVSLIAGAGCARNSYEYGVAAEADKGRGGSAANQRYGNAGAGAGISNGRLGSLGAGGATGAFGAPTGAPGGAGAGGYDIVYFSSDSVDLTPEAREALGQQARWLQKEPRATVSIEGHADERGTREYNIGLGERRAATVRKFLVDHGVPDARIRTTSFGKERPVATCNDISCWSQNRRAQTVIAPIGR